MYNPVHSTQLQQCQSMSKINNTHVQWQACHSYWSHCMGCTMYTVWTKLQKYMKYTTMGMKKMRSVMEHALHNQTFATVKCLNISCFLHAEPPICDKRFDWKIQIRNDVECRPFSKTKDDCYSYVYFFDTKYMGRWMTYDENELILNYGTWVW